MPLENALSLGGGTSGGNAAGTGGGGDIALQTRGITLPDPVAQYENALRLQRGQQQLDQGGLELQSAKQTLDDRTAAATYLRDPSNAGKDIGTISRELTQLAPLTAPGLLKGYVDNQSTLANTAATGQKMSIDGRNAMIQAMAGAHSPQELMQAGVDGIKQGAWKLEQFAPVMMHLADGTINDANFKDQKATMLTGILNAKDQFDASQPAVSMVDSGGAQVPYNTKASAGPIGPIPGAVTMPGTPKTTMTDRGMVATAPDASSAWYVPSGQPGLPQGASAGGPAWVGAEPQGAFVGDPNAIRAGLARITDPNDRAGAMRALQNQIDAATAAKAGGSVSTSAPVVPTAPVNGVGAKDYTTPQSAANFGEYEKGLNGRVETYQNMIPMIQRFQTALQGYQSGPSASTRGTLAKVVASIPGIDENSPLVQFVNRGPIANSQEIEKLQGTMALEGVKAILSGAGKLGQTEFRLLEPRFPGVDTDPQATNMIFDMTMQQANRTFAEQQALDKAKRTPGYDLTRFPAEWNQHLMESGALNAQPTGTTPATANRGPVDPKTIESILQKYRH